MQVTIHGVMINDGIGESSTAMLNVKGNEILAVERLRLEVGLASRTGRIIRM